MVNGSDIGGKRVRSVKPGSQMARLRRCESWWYLRIDLGNFIRIAQLLSPFCAKARHAVQQSQCRRSDVHAAAAGTDERETQSFRRNAHRRDGDVDGRLEADHRCHAKAEEPAEVV